MRLFLVAAGALLYSALYAVQPLLPAIERHFDVLPGAAGWGMTLPMLGLILGPWLGSSSGRPPDASPAPPSRPSGPRRPGASWP